MLKKLFKKPVQEADMTQETYETKARAKVRETVKKITEAENALARNAIAYAEALKKGDDDRCLAELENQDVTRRSLRLYNDQLPLHQAAVEEAIKQDAAPEIVTQCIEAQKLCDAEAQLIDAYMLACEQFRDATEALVQQSVKTNQALIVLNQDIKRVGSTERPAVNRAPFNKPMYVFDHARQSFQHFGERSITDYKNYSEAEL